MSLGVGIVGSTSSHGGTMISANGANLQTSEGAACINGDLHSCPIYGHGTTPVTANAVRSFVNGQPVILDGSVAGCGAIINGNFATKIMLS